MYIYIYIYSLFSRCLESSHIKHTAGHHGFCFLDASKTHEREASPCERSRWASLLAARARDPSLCRPRYKTLQHKHKHLNSTINKRTSLCRPIISPLAVKCECPQLSLLVITSEQTSVSERLDNDALLNAFGIDHGFNMQVRRKGTWSTYEEFARLARD